MRRKGFKEIQGFTIVQVENPKNIVRHIPVRKRIAVFYVEVFILLCEKAK